MSYGDVFIESNSKFLTIEAGVPHDLRLLDDDPTETYEHRSEGQMKPVPCQGEDICALCKEGHEPSQRFAANVYDHGVKRVLIWKWGAGLAKQLKAIAKSLEEENGSIMATDLKVEATGTGMQKRYTVTPRVNSKLIPEGLKKHDLSGAFPF